jgi:hypothetical protein
MARYDLMHWSQRVRDEQAAQRQAAPPPLATPEEPSPAPRKSRRQRPKPTPNPDADHVLQLCREGRLFELQQWIAAGRSIVMVSDYRESPLGIAVQSAFHGLIELLVQHKSDQVAKNAVLIEACPRAASRRRGGTDAPVRRGSLQRGLAEGQVTLEAQHHADSIEHGARTLSTATSTIQLS